MMSSMNCNDELQMAIKILMTKEIAGHIANYATNCKKKQSYTIVIEFLW